MVGHESFEKNPTIAIASLRALKPGQSLVYFRGFLDKAPSNIVDISSEAAELSDAGKVALTQRRRGPPLLHGVVDWKSGIGPGFDYIATGLRPKFS